MCSLRSTVQCAVCSYGFLGVRRGWWSKRGELGWPELVGNELGAAAGARPLVILLLQ